MTEAPVPQILRKIPMLATLPPWQMEVVAEAVEPLLARKGTLVVERGTDDGYTYFLTEGQIELHGDNGYNKTLDIDRETTRTPMANLRPRIISVKALTDVHGVRVPDIVLTAAGFNGRRYSPDEIKVDNDEEDAHRELESKLSFQLYQDLRRDRAILPSLPDLALRIRRAIEDESSDAREVARLVETDPAMTAKLLKVANSAFYAGTNNVETLPKAVVRLGMKTTKQLVMSFALRDIFKNKSPILQQRMLVLWKHSAQVAALCFVLARRTGRIDPEEALLIGLVHDIGTIAILNYVEGYPELAEDPDALEETITQIRGELGAMILREWKFAPAVIAGARDAEYWERQHAGDADFTDLLIVAQVHERLRKNDNVGLPPMERISAMQRVLGSDAGPERSLEILHEAKEQVDDMRSLLRA
ncbi:MAG: HDOD domain-containing protein [Gammaproteobacteria bacterium]|nr:HDOD domain-containing protein [Gammaproteobacteria bacterium]